MKKTLESKKNSKIFTKTLDLTSKLESPSIDIWKLKKVNPLINISIKSKNSWSSNSTKLNYLFKTLKLKLDKSKSPKNMSNKEN